MTITEHIKRFNITAPAVLLFMALLAQAPHAAAVFVRVAPHGAPWEVYVSAVGALVYAIALEGATAFFVWRSQIRWAIAFAVFSVLHNVAYYLPEAWAFDAFGAALLWRNVLGSVLISVSLPLAIAAFSHVQAQQREKRHTAAEDAPATHSHAPDVAVQQPAAAPHAPDVALIADHDTVRDAVQPSARDVALQMAGEGCSVAQIAARVGAKPTTVRSWLRRDAAKRNGGTHD